MDHARTAGALPKSCRDMLLLHLDGAHVAVVPTEDYQARRALLDRKLIVVSDGGPFRPKATQITEAGREVLSNVLAAYADALVAAGFARVERDKIAAAIWPERADGELRVTAL